MFSLRDEVLLYSEQVVIPTTLQKRILKDFHTGHPGITRMKGFMHSYVYWLNMDKDIENIVKSCKGCVLAVKAPPIKYRPWSWIYTDFAGPLDGFYYLIVGSKSLDVKIPLEKLQSISSMICSSDLG